MKVVNSGYKFKHGADFITERKYGSGDYVLLVIGTSAFFILDGKRIIAPKGSVIVYKKGTPQIYGATENEFINDWLHFELDDGDLEWVTSLGTIFDKPLTLYGTAAISELIKNIFLEQHSGNEYGELSASLYLKLIFLKLSESLKAQSFSADSVYTDALFALRTDIYSSPAEDWSISSICKRLNLSRSYVQHLYKATFGVTISADTVTSRIEYAKYLLFGTGKPISEIASDCGFKSDVHFMRTFKSIVGMTPTSYRKSSILKN